MNERTLRAESLMMLPICVAAVVLGVVNIIDGHHPVWLWPIVVAFCAGNGLRHAIRLRRLWGTP